MLNKVMLIGRLGRDPELRYASTGTAMANLRIATDESYVDRDGNKVDRTEWHTVVVFQRQAENCANYLGKGSLVFVEGSLQTRKWQDKDGQDRYTTEIKANRVQFLDRKGSGAEAGGERSYGGDMDESYNNAPRPSGGGQQRQAQPPQRQGGQQQQRKPQQNEDLGPAFPSEASGMDDVPF